MFIFLSVALLSIVTVFSIAFLRQPQFGKHPAGARRARILNSPNYREGKFQNQRFTPTFSDGVTYWDMIGLLFRGSSGPGPETPLPSVKTDLTKPPGEQASFVWFGHSSYLLHLDGRNILVDPVFSGNAAPVPFFGKSFPGTDAYTVADLPEIDLLLLTHDHYDHLDYQTAKQLKSRVKHVVASLGVGAHLEHWGYPVGMIQELDWYEKAGIDSTLNIQALPARHFSGRRFRRAQTLWSSFVLEGPSAKIYIGGDSGYDTHFREIGAQFGPFDFALLECGQYFDYWKNIHLAPEETVQAAIDLNARAFMPVHWGKFSLAPHHWKDPIERVTKKARELRVPIATPKIGERVVIGGEYPSEVWW